MRYKNGKGVGANYGQTYIDALKGIGIMMMIAGSLEICPGESVVRVPFEVGKAVLFGVGFQNPLLVAYGIGFPGKLVLVRQSRIKGGNELLGGLS